MSRKLTTQEWVDRARQVWGDRYDYSETTYDGASKKVQIRCPIHNVVFHQKPQAHVAGLHGCVECSSKMTLRKFLSDAEVKFPNKFDYSRVEFKTAVKHVTIGCKRHSTWFSQRPDYHLQGNTACPICLQEQNHDTLESFSQKVRDKWGDRWDLSKVEYVSSREKVTIVCRKHGDFSIRPNTLLSGGYCKRCSREEGNHSRYLLRRDEVVQKFEEAWQDSPYDWDYSNVTDGYLSDKVSINCPRHGEFLQLIKEHVAGHVGCRRCSGKEIDIQEAQSKALQRWGDRWDYSQTSPQRWSDKVTISCREHGPFKQVFHDHVEGHIGCPSCQSLKHSSLELELLEQVREWGFQDASCGVRGLLPNRREEIDIHIPSCNLGIEFNGTYYHSDKFIKDPWKHFNKFKDAFEQGIHLVQVWEDDYLTRREPVLRHLKSLLGVLDVDKVYARKTYAGKVSYREAQKFLEEYHVQGSVIGSSFYGLWCKDDLVAVAGFKKQGEDYVLTRYATSYHVVGGHSKIVSHFERSHSYRNLITFADLSFSDGSLYRKTGWEFDKLLEPDYMYLNGTRFREHKFKYRKNRFKTDPSLVYMESATERQMATMNGLLRVYDAGKARFIKPRPS